MADVEPDLEIREADDTDIEAIIETASAALGWKPDEPNAAMFRWKHLENPAGRSPMWIAVVDGQVAGFRTFLRWHFSRPDSTELVEAVRAVDTATHPDFQGRGIFSQLTRLAVDELTAAGAGFVFNTPNAQSRPGYLKMGWVDAGRVAVVARTRKPWRLIGARVPAEKWSLPNVVGTDVAAVLPGIVGSRGEGFSTDRTIEHLTWRYGFEPLMYRGYDHDRGQAVFRLRRRGSAIECTVCEHVGERRVLRDLLGETRADYLVVAKGGDSGGMKLPRGPLLTTRDLAEEAPTRSDAFSFGLGDIELF